MKKTFLLSVLFNCILFIGHGQLHSENNLPSILLYNPANSSIETIIEVATGNLCTTGNIDWQNVHLENNGKVVPFSIREGKAHWKADLKTPVKNPAPEDLLVFSLIVKPGEWTEINLVRGKAANKPVLKREHGMLSVFYSGMNVLINERSGLISGIFASGDTLLDKQMKLQFYETGDSVVSVNGNMNPGNRKAWLTLKPSVPVDSFDAKLVSYSSNEVMSEVNFILSCRKSANIGVTYRMYSSRQLEILADERPWTGSSPWLNMGLKIEFALAGEKKQLNGFQTHYPYYGFKDYASAVSNIGQVHALKSTKVFEFGEQAINGRFWKRTIAILPSDHVGTEKDIANFIDEKIVVKPVPCRTRTVSGVITVMFAKDDQLLGKMLQDQFAKNSPPSSSVKKVGPGTVIILDRSQKNDQKGITGDGFHITSVDNKIRISSITKFGLFKGISECIRLLKNDPEKRSLPMISSNPVIDLRAGGFGGGNIEVDFPYGDKHEWKRAFDGMMASGMSSMTDLGMWSNWKMPVAFRYMPELKSDKPDAYDEVSGARFSSYDSSRSFALEQINYLHAHGVKVWLWIPVGAVPTTFEEKFPEAMVEGKRKVPRFTHAAYQRYLESYFKEIIEFYPIDGFVLIRDDNGGIDDTKEFKEYLATSKTQDAVWEQYLAIYKLVRALKFKGDVAIYPYFDLYKPAIEEKIPKELLIVGHGSGMGTLTRNFQSLGTMPDTWLDNLFSGFRIPSTPRMKRMLSERGSYWIGGAYYGMELAWEAIGYFGWQPSATVSTFRYDYGVRNFGRSCGEEFLQFSGASDNLWEIMNTYLFPPTWFSLTDSMKHHVAVNARSALEKYNQSLRTLKAKCFGNGEARWFAQTDLYATYFDYHLQRAELAAEMEKTAQSNLKYCQSGQPLPDTTREKMLTMNGAIYSLAAQFDKQVTETPGAMLDELHKQEYTIPFKEHVYGYNGYSVSVDQILTLKQFGAEVQVTTDTVVAGKPIVIQITLRNTGFMAWMPDAKNTITVLGDTGRLNLSGLNHFVTAPVIFGDTLLLTLKGAAPAKHGSGKIKIEFTSPFFHNNKMTPPVELHLNW